MISRLKVWFKDKIDDIRWNIVDLYMHTWLWAKIGLPAYRFQIDLDNLCTKEDALYIMNKKRYKYVSKLYKLKLINEKFK